MPLFALANAGVELGLGPLRDALTSPVGVAMLVGLVAAKPVGVLLGTIAATRGGLPLLVSWPPLVSGAVACGIGFTLSIFIADLAFAGDELEHAKTAVLVSSAVAAALAWLSFRVVLPLLPARLLGAGRLAGELVDLDLPVDLEIDHVRGPAEAPVTLVEYGDYQCPYCGMAEGAVRELLAEFGDDLRYVWRHLPLQDVHVQRPARGGGRRGRGRAGPLLGAPRRPHLAPGRAPRRPTCASTRGSSGSRRSASGTTCGTAPHAGRVARDVESADLSRVAGTPTFFVNGRRHLGAYDAATLGAAVRAARARAARPAERA